MTTTALNKNETQIRLAIDEAIRQAVNEGLLVDTGKKRWSEKTQTYQTVWRRTRTPSLNRLH
jgi:hypothetical protein